MNLRENINVEDMVGGMGSSKRKNINYSERFKNLVFSYYSIKKRVFSLKT